MNRLVVLIATFLVASAATAQESTGNSTHSSCDFNQDGHVDEHEQRDCQSVYEKCDTNEDGEISDKEAHACEEAYGESNGTHDHEESNNTSASADACTEASVRFGSGSGESNHSDECPSEESPDHEESYHYEEGDPAAYCDFDQDGNVTMEEYEDSRCQEYIQEFHEEGTHKERERAIAEARASGLLGGSFNISDRVQQELETEEGIKVRIQHDASLVTTSTPSSGVKVTFDAELDEGRTFIIAIDPELFGNADILVRYFVVHPETGVELEGSIQEATDLQDILNPSDDGDAAEYWMVEDAEGLHVMVSIPHWSVHSVALEADSSGAVGTPGPALPLAIVSLAVLAVVARRRLQ